jgi:predicted lipoprotein with Yx(FWY)xxD motif
VSQRSRAIGIAVVTATVTAGVMSSPAGAVSRAKHTTISTVKTDLGRVVSNSKGRVMFRFLKDHRNVSKCNRSCRAVWPPVTSRAKAKAGPHIRAKHLGLTSKGQVSYYGHPLYYYVNDPTPGQTTGDGISEFGARWFIVSPKGKSVKPQPAGGDGAQVSTGTAGGTEVITNGADGHTLYELSSDAPPTFACTAGCLSAWPPLLTDGTPTAAGDAVADKLDTVSRTVNGATVQQVTYNGFPLYEFSGDGAAGDANGDGFTGPSSGTWHDVLPDGSIHSGT